MHRLPYRSCLDVLRLECQANRFAVDTEFYWIDQNACEPTRAAIPRRLGHELDARQVSESPLVKRTVRSARIHTVFQHAKLSAANTREHITHPIIVADL